MFLKENKGKVIYGDNKTHVYLIISRYIDAKFSLPLASQKGN